ncbi:MAG: hypothetical protein ACM3X7_04740 [Solirubrobacterales bacterium]
MEQNRLAPHETIEVRELINQEMLGIKKVNASINMVNSPELKSFMQDSITCKQNALKNIKSAVGQGV